MRRFDQAETVHSYGSGSCPMVHLADVAGKGGQIGSRAINDIAAWTGCLTEYAWCARRNNRILHYQEREPVTAQDVNWKGW